MVFLTNEEVQSATAAAVELPLACSETKTGIGDHVVLQLALFI